MKRVLWILLIVCLAALPAMAQVRPFNEAGVAGGHQHLASRDVTAYNAFWNTVGEEPAALGATQILKLPGMFFMVQGGGARGGGGGRGGGAPGGAPAGTPPAGGPPPAAAGAPPAGGAPGGGGRGGGVPAGPLLGSEGSTVDYIGFKVKDLKATLAKLDTVGAKPLAGATATQAFVMSPEMVKVQFVEDKTLATAIAHDEILMKVPSVADASAWYAKWFGAKIVKQGQVTVAQIPGMNIRFAETKDPVAGTQGRAIDHIGFEVKGLEALAKKLTDEGVKVNRAYAAAPAQLAPLKSIMFITDPWGTYIELNEGFADVK
jgi:catechol 2,3-dioxygenase-like lactoylglutathione lyase family enzyme